MRRELLIAGGVGLGVLALVGASRTAKAATSKRSASDILGGGGLSPSGDWIVNTSAAMRELRGDAARDRLRGMASSLERRYDIDGLADFLDAVAATETGRTYAAKVHGDLTSQYPSIGLFQMKEMSAYKSSDGLKHIRYTPLGMQMLETPDTAVILATNHAVQAIEWANRYGDEKSPCGAGKRGDWLAVRRFWKYPSRVYDWCESNEGSAGTRRRLEKALDFTGMPHSFMYQTPDVSGWPGVKQVFADYGIPLPQE